MIVVAKKEIPNVCTEGQRMFVTKHFDTYVLHTRDISHKKVTRKWIEKFFEIIKEGY